VRGGCWLRHTGETGNDTTGRRWPNPVTGDKADPDSGSGHLGQLDPEGQPQLGVDLVVGPIASS
jgi:hypothetical protein